MPNKTSILGVFILLVFIGIIAGSIYVIIEQPFSTQKSEVNITVGSNFNKMNSGEITTSNGNQVMLKNVTVMIQSSNADSIEVTVDSKPIVYSENGTERTLQVTKHNELNNPGDRMVISNVKTGDTIILSAEKQNQSVIVNEYTVK